MRREVLKTAVHFSAFAERLSHQSIRRAIASFASLVCCFVLWGAPANATIIDFESMPPGTLYGGAAGDLPGDIVLSQSGINMSVQQFFLGSYVGFVKAEVGGKYDGFFPTTPLGLENISVLFDFTGMGADVTSLTLEYQQFGGANNFAVNGGTIHEVNAFSSLPTNIAPGVFAFVTNSSIILSGDINTVRVGGQELAIDNVNAIPEPGSCLLVLLGGAILHRRRIRKQNC